jgi:hypothetical protein
MKSEKIEYFSKIIHASWARRDPNSIIKETYSNVAHMFMAYTCDLQHFR